MNLDANQRLRLLKIVTELEEGQTPVPRVGGPVGRFLGEAEALRGRVRELIPFDGTFVSGQAIGAIRLTPLGALRERLDSALLGEHGSIVAFSEELAGVLNLTLWGKARPANQLRNLWLLGAVSVLMTGAFRWFAPRRLTPGTASVTELPDGQNKWTARCLKFMAEEFLAPPAAASYRWDQEFGPADFRAVRIAALYGAAENWCVIPYMDTQLATPLVVSWAAGTAAPESEPTGLALALLTRTPWENRWIVADAKLVDPTDALAHMITWLDHRHELAGLPAPTAADVGALQRTMAAIGYSTVRAEALRRANLARSVAPAAKPLAAWIRGLA